MKTLAVIIALLCALAFFLMPSNAKAALIVGTPPPLTATSAIAGPMPTTTATTSPVLTKKEKRALLKELKAEIERLEKIIRKLRMSI